MKLQDFYIKASNGCPFAMLSLQMQIVVGETDKEIVVIYFNPTEQGVATKFVKFIIKYAHFHEKIVKITTGGERDFNISDAFFYHYHRKVTYWLLQKGFEVTSVTYNRNNYRYNAYFWYNLSELSCKDEREEIVKGTKYLDYPMDYCKIQMVFKP